LAASGKGEPATWFAGAGAQAPMKTTSVKIIRCERISPMTALQI
jgi:hypothetical protein